MIQQAFYRPSLSKPTCLDHRALAAQILAVQPFWRNDNGAPLVVKGKVFVGISGGEMGLHARAEQSEPLSGSANAMLCLAGRLSQSFNRAQVIHKTCVTGTLVFLIFQAQERRRVNGDQELAVRLRDRGLRRDCSESGSLVPPDFAPRLLRGRR